MNAFDILNQNTRFAVVGMHEDPTKYANRIFHKLLEKDKVVYGVNPKYDTIDGHTIYKSIDTILDPVDVAVFVVNPTIGIHMLESVKAKGINYLWLQPGTVDADLLAKAEELDLIPIQACVLALYNQH